VHYVYDLFGERPLTESARCVLSIAEKLAKGTSLDAGHVLLAIVTMDDNYSTAQRLHQIGFKPEGVEEFCELYALLMGPGYHDPGRESLTKMAQHASESAHLRRQNSHVFIVDLAVGAVMSKSWLIGQVTALANAKSHDVLQHIGGHFDYVLREM
jgi:hypothetical protein